MYLFVLRYRPGAGHCLPQVSHGLQGERHLEGHHGARVHTEDVKHPGARCLPFVLSQRSHVSNLIWKDQPCVALWPLWKTLVDQLRLEKNWEIVNLEIGCVLLRCREKQTEAAKTSWYSAQLALSQPRPSHQSTQHCTYRWRWRWWLWQIFILYY